MVRALLASGVPESRLRCVVRDPARAARAGLPEGCLHRADLARAEDEAALAAAARGVGVVVHCAAAVKALDAAGYHAVNVDGTARLLRAIAATAPGAHVVHVSSLAAAGPSIDGANSAAMPDAGRPVSEYGASKLAAERLVVAGARSFTIVRPPVVYGPGDPATRLLFRQARGPFAVVPPRATPLSIVHVLDVVDVLLRAIARRPADVVIPIDGRERTDTHELLRSIAAACGRRVRLVPVPFALASGAAVVCDAFAKVTRSPGYFSRDKMREIRACGWVADGEPARRLLDFAPRLELAAGLASVAAAEGFVRVTSATA